MRGSVLRRVVLPRRGWELWAPCQARGIGEGNGERVLSESATERGMGEFVLRGMVSPWRGWVLWAPCQARGIGRGNGERVPE